jgi:hypothetical protein
MPFSSNRPHAFCNSRKFEFNYFLMNFSIFNIIFQRVKKPKLFWVSAIAPMTTVVIGGIFTYLVKGQNHGIQIVSYITCLFFFQFLSIFIYIKCNFILYLYFNFTISRWDI